MKFSSKYFAILGLTAILSGACKKTFEKMVVEDTDLSDKALVKMFNATVSSQRTYLYVNDVPVTGAALAYNGIFPSTGYAAAVTPGSPTMAIRDTLRTTTQPAISFQATLAAGKNYSVFTYDTVNSIKYLLAEDKIEIPADTSSRLRFVNLIFSKTALPNVDVFSVKRNANIFTNVPIAQPTEFIPYASRQNDTLYVRATGTTTNLTTVFAIAPVQKRSYTVIYRGRYQTTTGTVMPRGLTSMANY